LFDPTSPPIHHALPGASAFFDLPVKRDVTAPFQLRARAKATPTTTPRNCSFLSRTCAAQPLRIIERKEHLPNEKESQTRAHDRICFATLSPGVFIEYLVGWI
jgi:hypothetical protein